MPKNFSALPSALLAKISSAPRLSIICLLACCVVFVWACGRGFDFRDDAMYLVWAADVTSFRESPTAFGSIWHPVYALSNGSIAFYRLEGCVALIFCGGFFGYTLARFANLRTPFEISTIVAICATAVFREYSLWQPTPNYNSLNLCAHLLLFSGLSLASRSLSAEDNPKSLISTVTAAMLAGGALSIIALGKPTSCITALALAIGWVVLVRPHRAWLCTGVAALSSLLITAAIAILIDGSITAFISKELASFKLIAGTSGADAHGTWSGVVGPFLPGRRWKIIPAVIFSSSLFLICLASFAAALRLKDAVWRNICCAAGALLFGALVCALRIVDASGTEVVPAYHAWYFAIMLVPIAVIAAALFWNLQGRSLFEYLHPLGAFAILSLVPLSYSFGTNNAVVLHMTRASVFWAADAVLLIAMLRRDVRPALLRTTAMLVGTAILGTFIGVMARPVVLDQPLWRQSVPIKLGPERSTLLVDAETASYIDVMKRGADARGFLPGTPIIDLSGAGPGLIYALNGTAAGAPWMPDNAPKYAASMLRTVPQSKLIRSWVLCTPSSGVNRCSEILRTLDLNFPAGYTIVIEAKHRNIALPQVLWKPITR